MKTIYLLIAFKDLYKKLGSVYAAALSQTKIRKCVEYGIRKGVMYYSAGGSGAVASKTAQIRMLRNDWKEFDLTMINARLGYGSVATFIDGEAR